MLDFARLHSITSFDNLAQFNYSPTARQRDQVIRRLADSDFATEWSRAFVNDKFGRSTTHWDKLQERIRRGVGNPCPLAPSRNTCQISSANHMSYAQRLDPHLTIHLALNPQAGSRQLLVGANAPEPPNAVSDPIVAMWITASGFLSRILLNTNGSSPNS